jgi:hypothetical protein
MADVLARYNRLGFSLTVYPNRIEVVEGVMRKRTIIPLRNVANVEKTLTNKVIIHTNDGKKQTFVCGLQTGKIYDAIMAAL